MSKKGLVILAVLGAILIGALLAGCGGSSSHSSEWESPDIATLKMNIEYEVSELSSDQVDCMAEKIEGEYPPSVGEEIDKGEEPSSEQSAKMKEFAEDCVGSSSDSDSSDSEIDLPESAIGGPACEEDLESSACEDESNERIEQATEEEMEIYEE